MGQQDLILPVELGGLDHVQELLPGMDARLLVDVANMGLDRVNGDCEMLAHILGIASLTDEAQDLVLPVRQMILLRNNHAALLPLALCLALAGRG